MLLAASLVVVGAAFLAPRLAGAQSKRAVNPPGSPTNLPFSNGIVVGNTLYVAGTQGTISGDIKKETASALENIRKIVEAAGFSMSDIVAVNVYLADVKEFGAMNEVYREVVPDPKPTRTTVGVAQLIGGAHIEISAIAVKGH
ncbi:MAG TPA: RidA family protein [Terriglobia bacterium]|nr:RidA family protein [Terriglobia bacterium]